MKSWDACLGALIVLGLSLFGLSLWPTVAGGDNGELIAAAFNGGAPHPPGYPLFAILGHLFGQLPLGSVAWRLHLMNALVAILASVFFYWALLQQTQHRALSFSVTLLLFFSPIFWRYSILAEVFTLNHFFIAWTLWYAPKFFAEPSRQRAALIGVMTGLSFSNHHTFVLAALPLAILMLRTPGWRRPSSIFLAFSMTVFGMLPYLYLPWASIQLPVVHWGESSNWEGFWRHFLRQEYGTFQLVTKGEPGLQVFSILWLFLKEYFYHGLVVLPVSFVGFVWALREKPASRWSSLQWWLILAPGLYLAVFALKANIPLNDQYKIYQDVLSRFWQMPMLFLAFAGGLGLHWFLGKFQKRWQPWLIAFLLVLGGFQMVRSWRLEAQPNNFQFHRFGEYLLSSLPEESVLFSLSDLNTNALRYLQVCERHRPDVVIMDRAIMSFRWFKPIALKHYPQVRLPGQRLKFKSRNSYNLGQLFTANIDQHRLFVTALKQGDGSRESKDNSWQKDYQLIPYGLTFEVVPKNHDIDMDQYISESEKFLPDMKGLFATTPEESSWERVIYNSYLLAFDFRSVFLLQEGVKPGAKPQVLLAAMKAMEQAVSQYHEPRPDHYRHLGLVYHRLIQRGAQPRDQLATRRRQSWAEFLKTASEKDPLYGLAKKVLGD